MRAGHTEDGVNDPDHIAMHGAPRDSFEESNGDKYEGFWCKLCFDANVQIHNPLNSLAYILFHIGLRNGRLHQRRTGPVRAI